MIWIMMVVILILGIIITMLVRSSIWGSIFHRIIFHERVVIVCIFIEIVMVMMILPIVSLEISGHSPTISEEISSSTYDVSIFSADLVTDGKYRFTVNGEKYEIYESNEPIVEIDSDSPSKVEISEIKKTSLFTFITYEYKNYRFY